MTVNNYTINRAIQSLFPSDSPSYSVDGDTLAGITWHDEVLTRPTDEAITAAVATVESETLVVEAVLAARKRQERAAGLTYETMVDALAAKAAGNSTAFNALMAIRQTAEEDNPLPMEE